MQKTHDIDDNLTAYQDMQERHLAILDQNELPDLEAMTREREDIFRPLQVRFQALTNKIDSNTAIQALPLLQHYETRLKRIAALDDKIESKIKQHRERLKQLMGRLKHGKKAMNGYAQLAPQSSPRVVNMNR